MLRRLAEGPYGTVMAGARGKGNILSVVYRPYRAEDDWKEWPCRMSSVYPLLPPRVYHRNMFRFWEYLYSDLARRLLDAASVPAPVTVAEAAVNRGPGGIRLQLNLTHSAAARPARCRAAWIGPEYQTVTQRIVRTTLAPGSNRLDMPLEGLARTGPQAVHLWIETPDGKILAWAAVAFHQEGPKVARIAVARERYEPGESIEGRVAIDGVLDGLRCVIELQDTFGRVVARREQAASTNLAFALDSAGVLSRLACVTAELRRNGGVLHRAAVDVPVPRDLDATDYNVGIWASYVAQVERRHWAPEMIEQQRRLGVDFSLMAHGYSDDYYHSYVRRNMVPVPDNLHRIFFKLKDYYRQLNLADPAHRRKIAEEVAANARYGYRWGSFDYSIGDECGYDVKRDPLTFARFKAHLVARYETVDALNAQWSTRYASWDELRDFPRAEQDYDPAVSIAPQLEHRRFMDDLFIETIAGIRQQLKTLDPRNRTGISGTRDPGHYIGFDWWKLMNNVDHLTFYDGIQREAIVRDDVGPLLRLGQMLDENTRNLRHAFFLRGDDPAMTGNDVQFLVDDDRIDKSKFPQACPQLENLLFAVCPGIPGIRHQLIDIHFFKTLGGFHYFPLLAVSSRSITSSCGFVPAYSPVQFSLTIWKISNHRRFVCDMKFWLIAT